MRQLTSVLIHEIPFGDISAVLIPLMPVKTIDKLNLDRLLFRTRMCAIILFRQMTEVQVCVDLGCRNIGVTEKLLNRSNIAA